MRIFLVTLAASLVLANAAWAGFVKVDLGTLGGNNSEALDINRNGLVVGWSETAGGYRRAFSWSPSAGRRMLPVLPGGRESVAVDVSDSGYIVGYSTNGANETHVVVWLNGVITDTGAKINTFPLDNNYEYYWRDFKKSVSVNYYGQVVGFLSLNDYNTRGFLWSKTMGLIDLQGTIEWDADWFFPTRINDKGTIVADMWPGHYVYIKPLDNNHDGKPDTWVELNPDGSNSLIQIMGGGGSEPNRDLPDLNNFGKAVFSSGGIDAFWRTAVFDTNNPPPDPWPNPTSLPVPLWATSGGSAEYISDLGTIAGEFWVKGTGYNFFPRAGIWDKNIPFPFTTTRASQALCVNNFRQAAGWMISTTGYRHAMFADKKRLLTDLGTLGGRESEAYVINSMGWVAGWANVSNGNRHAALWKVTEPIVMDIDIKPGVSPNVVNTSERYVPVAVLRTDFFNSTLITLSSARLSGAAAASYVNRDVNGDGKVDRVFNFYKSQVALTRGKTVTATFTGRTTGGTSVWGQDAVLIK